MKKYVWTARDSVEGFFEKLGTKAYEARPFCHIEHWGEFCFFVKRSRNNRFRIEYQQGIVSNSFKWLFYGKAEETADGLRVSGHFLVHPFTLAFFTLWFGALIFILFSALLAGKWVAALPCLAMAGIGTGAFWLFRGNPKKIVALLEETCATPLSE